MGASSWAGAASQTTTDLPVILPRALGRGLRSAALLVANLSHRFVEGTNWDYSEFAVYDLGQAVADHMTFQAQYLGLSVRQFHAFDHEGLATEFDVPPHWEITTMSAIGRALADLPPPLVVAPNGEQRSRDRRPVTDVRWPHAAPDHR